MPFDESEQDQDETAMQPWRFGYRLPVEESSESQPSIGMRIMQMAPPQAQPDAPGPLRGIDALQQTAQGDLQPEPRPSIGQRIMQIGRQGVPPFDIQDGRPVWRQDTQTPQKASIGQRIMRGAYSGTQGAMPSTGYDLSSWETRPETARNAGQSKPFMLQPVQGFSLSNSLRPEPSGQTYQHPESMSSPAPEADKETLQQPAAFSANAFKESSAKGGGPEFLRGPLDFNEFASFVGGGQQESNSNLGDQSSLSSYGSQPAQQQAKTVPEASGRVVEASTGTPRAQAVDKTKPAPEAWSGNGQPGRGKKNPPVPPVTGSVGIGAKNNPADVKWVQQLLNAAIDDDELPGGKIPEDGKVTDAMLKLLAQYQSANRLRREAVVDYRSQTLKKLAENPLFDPRWSKYDDIIKKEVAYYNDLFKKEYPEGFQPLDWRRVKAMLWVEVQGPDVRDPNDWLTWPLRIGKLKADHPAMDAIKNGLQNTDKYVPEELRQKLKAQKMTGDLNIRAGVAYLYNRAIASWQTKWRVNDPAVHFYQVQPGDTLESIARANHTTVGELLQDNKLDKNTATSIRPTDQLQYRLATEIPQWYEWPTASFRYNSTGDRDYSAKVERNYVKIKRRW